jgi:hypothetical protein
MRELPDPGDLDDRVIAAGHEPLEQGALGASLAGSHGGRAVVQPIRTDRPLDERQEAGNHDTATPVCHRGKDGEPLGRLVVLGQRPLERQRGPLGKRPHVRRADPCGKVVGETVRLVVGPCDDHERGGSRQVRESGREMRGSRGCGHTKDARLRQMGPKGVDKRGYAAITAA